ncbi:MAG: hypothetical protein ABWY38_01420 [Methyloceanibacter sp.]
MLRCTFAAAVLLAGAALFVPPPAFAESGGAPPADNKDNKEVEKPPEGDAEKAKAQAKAEQEATAKAMEEYRAAATTLPSAAGAAECVWTGRRIASLLWRDDIDTARRYIDLYDRFGCSPKHLKLVFRCVIQQGPLDPKAADRLASRVHDCWMAPGTPTTAASQATTSSTEKGGTISN